ncbi:MAG: glycosyltransferase [Phormidium sp. GEM2.Bin31]|nr:MAG: glycosyltransferase [Phormidium sp. GEM2.Bin31]
MEFATRDFVYGWVQDKSNPDRPLWVDVYVGDLHLGIYPAKSSRADLARLFPNQQFSGFEIKIPPSLSSDRPLPVRVMPHGGTQALLRSPQWVRFGPQGQPHPHNPKEGSGFRYPMPPQCADTPAIALIILNLNGAALLEALFRSFAQYNRYPQVELIVVDHGSTDDSLQVCDAWTARLPIRVLDRQRNYSFAESNNFAAAQTDAPLLLFVNNDIQFCQDILSGLVEMLQDESLGVVGVKLLDYLQGIQSEQAPIQHLGIQFNFYSPFESFSPFELRAMPQQPDRATQPWRVPAVTGAMMLCRRAEFLKLGGFLEDYFYGYEDVDLCLRYQKELRKEIVCASHLAAQHHRGISRFQKQSPRGFLSRIGQNRQTLEKEFGVWLRRRHWQDFFDRGCDWTGHPLRVGFVVTEARLEAAAGDYFTALELGSELVEQYGWQVFYLAKTTEEAWYDVHQLDVLIVTRHDYDLGRLENAKPGLLTVAWIRNWFDQWAAQPWSGEYDCVWSSSGRAIAELEQQFSKVVTEVKIATNPERFSPQGEVSEAFKSDYCFTGSFWSVHREIIDYLRPERLPFSFALYGHHWQQFPQLTPYYRGAVAYDQLPQVYRGTKIVIDDANTVTKAWGSVNSRVFDAISAGALVLTNGQAGSEDVFGGLLPTFDSAESLETLLRTYLEHEDLRRERVAALQQHVWQQETYAHRASSVWTALRHKVSQTYRIGIKVGVPRWEERQNWGDYHFAQSLKRVFEQLGHSVRIDILPDWQGSRTFGDDVVIVLRGLSFYEPQPHQLNLLWLLSHPDKVTPTECEAYDQVFVASESYAASLQTQVTVPVQPLLQCTDPQRFYPDVSELLEVPAVLFVGNSRRVYRPIVRDALAAGLPLGVYGQDWQPWLSSLHWRGTGIPNERLRQYYSGAGVVLNDHWQTMREQGFLSNRLFDAAASGAMIVSDAVVGLEAVFGEAIATYETVEELGRRVRERLHRREETQEQRLQLADWVRRTHSFEQRVAVMLAAIEALFEAS